jgi:3-oxoacyl-[acyl-carrier protein] reductase
MGRITALVTGSNRGIGKAIADKFEAEGFNVVRNGLSNSDQKNYVKADIGIKNEVLKIKKYISDNFSGLDILVNNAAYTKFIQHDNLNGLSESLMNKILDTNVKGPIYCTQVFEDFLKISPEGQIINIASIAGITGQGSNIMYCASKSALITLTKSLAKSLAPIRVNSISPGFIETGFVKFPDGYNEKTIQKTPLNRSGQPVDIANVAWGLVQSKFITGENIVVDGGLIL